MLHASTLDALRTSTSWWQRRREKIILRDGGRCIRCGSTENLTIDHIKARSLGGTDALWNLQTLCSPCNAAKSREESRLAMERPGLAMIICTIESCPWCFGVRRTPRRMTRGILR